MSTSNRHGLSAASIETIAGLSAGLVSTVVVHPLDIIKTRLQGLSWTESSAQLLTSFPVDTSSHPLLNSSRAVFRDILRNEGPTRLAALYRGLTPNLIGNSAGWGLYFLWYKEAQDVIRSYRGYTSNQALTSVDYFAAASASGFLSAVLTNPIWVVKTRMLSTSGSQPGAYPSMIHGLASIWRTEGARGFFHGLTPTLVGVSHGSLYFLAYEKLKAWRRLSKRSGDLTNVDTLITSSLSKVFAGVLTYPHQLVRARMQTYDPSSPTPVRGIGVMGTIRSVWVHEGFTGFYKGMFPNLLRVVPSTCVTFLVYENVRWRLPKMFGGEEPSAKINVGGNTQQKKGTL